MPENYNTEVEQWTPGLIQTIGPTNAYGVVGFYSGVHPMYKSAEVGKLCK